MNRFVKPKEAEIDDLKKKLPRSLEDAEIRYNLFKEHDPYPHIDPALLNSADIIDYAIKTGFLYPFHLEKLKPASYEVNFKGKCVQWSENGKREVTEIGDGNEFVLRKNSIAFVTLEPHIRLPAYIAIRFNLKITHVYRGLLLGTGPLVDPGFDGMLSIPLHNLTTNDYTLVGGEGLIWMEFTKISRHEKWTRDNSYSPAPSQVGYYHPFPKRKNELKDVEHYLRKADPHRPVRSSIPDAVREAQETARAAMRRVNLITFGGIVTLAALIVGLYYPTSQILQSTLAYIDEARSNIKVLEKEHEEMKKEIEALKKRKVVEGRGGTGLHDLQNSKRK